MKSFSLLLLLSLLISCVYVQCDSPGVILTMGNSSLAEGLEYELPNILTSYFENITLPEISGTTREFLIFEITYNITNLLVETFTMGSISIQYIPNGIQINIDDVACYATCDWSYTDRTLIIIRISGEGNATMSFSGGSYQMQLLIEENNGHPELKLKKSKLNLKNFDLQLDADAMPWFYDFFTIILQPIIKREIEGVVEDLIQQVVDQGNELINEVPLLLPIIEGVGFDWRLLNDFDTSLSPGFGSFYSAGYFLPLAQQSLTPPFPLSVIPTQVNYNLIQLIISEYTYNSLGWALYESGALNFTVPLGTTNNFRLIIPSLYRAYPDAPLEAQIVGLTYPNFILSSASGLTFQFEPLMYWNVKQNNVSVNAFVLDLGLKVIVDLSFDNEGLLHGKVSVPTFDMSLYSSNIGRFSLVQLQIALNTLINVILLPAINLQLKNGIEIPPIKGIALDNPQLDFGDGFMFISTNFELVTNSTNFFNPFTLFNQLQQNLYHFSDFIQLEDEWTLF